MSSPTKTEKPLASVADSPSFADRMPAYVELTKMRISIMVVLTFIVAAIVSQPGFIDVPILFWGTIGCLLICFSGNAMNMYVERKTDLLMPRTAGRPLPAEKLTSLEVLAFGALTFVLSAVIFWYFVNWQTTVCAAINLSLIHI